MSTAPSSPSSSEPHVASLDALDELIAEVAHLQTAIVEELLDRRARLCRELLSIDAELAELEQTIEPAPVTRKRAPAKTGAEAGRKPTLPELVAELEAAPERTLNIRKAHLDVKHTRALAKANAETLQIGGKGGWPTVTLRATAPQELFAFEGKVAEEREA